MCSSDLGRDATPGPWQAVMEGGDWLVSSVSHGLVASGIHDEPDVDILSLVERDQRDAEHIAAMHPLVGLALADWLEREASLLDAQVFPQSDSAMEKYPLAVARAYLTEAVTA